MAHKPKHQLGILSFCKSPASSSCAADKADIVIEAVSENKKHSFHEQKEKLVKNNGNKPRKNSRKCKANKNDEADHQVQISAYLPGSSNVVETCDNVVKRNFPIFGHESNIDDNACNFFENKYKSTSKFDGTTIESEFCSVLSNDAQNFNVFSFMMNNRHKQDEAIKKLAEEEKIKKEIEEANLFMTKNPHVPPIQPKWKDNNNSLNFSPQSAFTMLMSGKKKEPLSAEERDDPDFNPFSEIIKKNRFPKKGCKKAPKASDSSLVDLEDLHIHKTSNLGNMKQNSDVTDRGKTPSPVITQSKLDLIDDKEEIDLEETFKDEILECVNSGKKKSKKRKPLDTNNGPSKNSEGKRKSNLSKNPVLTLKNKKDSNLRALSETTGANKKLEMNKSDLNGLSQSSAERNGPPVLSNIQKTTIKKTSITKVSDAHVDPLCEQKGKLKIKKSVKSYSNKDGVIGGKSDSQQSGILNYFHFSPKHGEEESEVCEIEISKQIPRQSLNIEKLQHDIINVALENPKNKVILETESMKNEVGEPISSPNNQCEINKSIVADLFVSPFIKGSNNIVTNALRNVRIFKDDAISYEISANQPRLNLNKLNIDSGDESSKKSEQSPLSVSVHSSSSSCNRFGDDENSASESVSDSMEVCRKTNGYEKEVTFICSDVANGEVHSSDAANGEVHSTVDANDEVHSTDLACIAKKETIDEKIEPTNDDIKEATIDGIHLDDNCKSKVCTPKSSPSLRRSSRKVRKTTLFESESVEDAIINKIILQTKRENNSGLSKKKNSAISRSDSEKENIMKADSKRDQNVGRVMRSKTLFDHPTKDTTHAEKKSSKIQKQKLRRSKKEVDLAEIPAGEEIEDIILIDSPTEETKRLKNAKKLAPIFVKKDSQTVISPSKIKAKMDFLFSDSPDEVKIISIKSESVEEPELWPCFPIVSHVCQNAEDDSYFQLVDPNIPALKEETQPDIIVHGLSTKLPYDFMDDKAATSTVKISNSPPLTLPILCQILCHLKNKSPSFPVYSIFKSYLGNKEDAVNLYKKEIEAEDNNAIVVNTTPNKKLKRKRHSRLSVNKRRKLNKSESCEIKFDDDNGIVEYPIWHQWTPYCWSTIFAPKTMKNIVGNSALVLNLNNWLEQWKRNIEVQTAREKHTNKPGKRVDDSDSNDSDGGLVNAVLLSGPSGVGKTCTVFALAHDLGFEVLEVNASSRRTGKQVISQLSEATQSHNVASEKNDALPNTEQKKNLALILFKDIDIVFEESDEGFLSAVSYFMSTSKRPIILTTSNPTPCTKSKIKGEFSEITFTRPNPLDVAQYLQLMCLANGVFSSAKEVEAVVAGNNGDIRKSIQDLQFWSMSGASKVEWLKMDCKSFSKSVSENENSIDIPLSEIFPDYSLRKSVDVPICLGCSWSRSDIEQLKACEMPNNGTLNWALFSGNAPSFLPFNLMLKEKSPMRFPLTENDPLVKNTSLWQRHCWLSIDSDSDSENMHVKKDENPLGNKDLYPPEVLQAASSCVNSLSIFLRIFTDLDIFNSNYEGSLMCPDLNTWWSSAIASELDCINDCNNPRPICSEMSFITELSSSVNSISYNILNKDLLNHLHTVDCRKEWPPLTVPVESIPPSLLLHPHQFLSACYYQSRNQINRKLSKLLSSSTRCNRYSVVMDYLTYIRSFARIDQLGEAVQKQRRGRRFLSHMKGLGFYISKDECIDLCNMLFNQE